MEKTFEIYKLLLDDLRDIGQCYPSHPAYFDQNWVVARNYDEFVEVITKVGMPEFITFDHDIHPSHYTPPEFWDDYEKSKAYQEKQQYTEKTGLDCAKWLIEHCIENNFPLPEYTVHSFNPVGADNIRSYLEQAKKHLSTLT